MTTPRTALIIAASFFTGWLAILYAGADHPPPPGFIVIVLVDLVAAGVVYFRVPTYIRWANIGKKRRVLRSLLDGGLAGLVIAALILLVPGSGEPTVQPPPSARGIWFLVLGAVGAANGLLIYGLSALLRKKAAE